jgi:hypothetical protein
MCRYVVTWGKFLVRTCACMYICVCVCSLFINASVCFEYHSVPLAGVTTDLYPIFGTKYILCFVQSSSSAVDKVSVSMGSIADYSK